MPHRGSRLPFLLALALLVAAVGYHNFNRFYLTKDYPLQVFTACDSTKYSCFVADADSADPTFQNEPYAKVEISASAAPHCLDEHTCTDFTCTGVHGACIVKYCSDATLETGETCSVITQ